MKQFNISLWNFGANMGSAPHTNTPFFKVFQVIQSGGLLTANNPPLSEITDKRKLPFITASGTFKTRRAKDLIEGSELLCVDIDHLETEELIRLKEVFRLDPHILACHTTFSKKGLAVYVHVPLFNDPDSHSDTYRALEKYFIDEYNIIIDPACKDISRARFICHDPDAWISLDKNLKPFKRKISQKDKKREERLNKPVIFYNGDIPPLIERILDSGADITQTYDQWLKIAFALAGSGLPNARELFHQISSRHEKYNPADTDKKFDNAAANNTGAVSLGSVVWLARQYGIADPYPEENKQIYYSLKNLKGKPIDPLLTQYEPERVKAIAEQVENGAVLPVKGDDDLTHSQKVRQWLKDIIYPELVYDTLKRQLFYEGDVIENKIDGITLQISDLYDNFGSCRAIVKAEFTSLINNPPKEIQYDPLASVIESNLGECDGAIDAIIELVNFKTLHDQNGEFNPAANDQELAIKRSILKKWFIGLHAQIDSKNRRGVNEIMPIFITKEQGVGKTQAVSHFLPNELQQFANVVNMAKPDAELQRDMEQNIILINDELYGATKKEINRVKALLSMKYYQRRDLFKDNNRERQRICSFIGLSNDIMVVSEDRNRRFIPLELAVKRDEKQNQNFAIRHDILHDNNELRLKAFSEGYKLYKSGAEYWLSAEDREWINTNLNNDYKYQTDAEISLMDYLTIPSEELEHTCQVYTAREIAEFINDKNYIKVKPSEVRRILTAKIGKAKTHRVDKITKHGWRVELSELKKQEQF